MQITQLHKSLSQLTWDDVVSKILLMRNRRRVSSVPAKPVKAKVSTKTKNKKQPKQLDLFACANTLTQDQKDLLFQELSKLMED